MLASVNGVGYLKIELNISVVVHEIVMVYRLIYELPKTQF
jgi:hypothetical protein